MRSMDGRYDVVVVMGQVRTKAPWPWRRRYLQGRRGNQGGHNATDQSKMDSIHDPPMTTVQATLA